MVNEGEMKNRRCDRIVPAANPGPVVLAQIGLQKPHKRRPSMVVLNRGMGEPRSVLWITLESLASIIHERRCPGRGWFLVSRFRFQVVRKLPPKT